MASNIIAGPTWIEFICEELTLGWNCKLFNKLTKMMGGGYGVCLKPATSNLSFSLLISHHPPTNFNYSHFVSSSQYETISATGSDNRQTKEAIKADRNAMARVRVLYRMGKELGMF